VRIGIALGDATCEDGDYFGTPVIEASRLVRDGGGAGRCWPPRWFG